MPTEATLLREFRVWGFAAITAKTHDELAQYDLADRLETVAAMRDEILRPFVVPTGTTTEQFNHATEIKVGALTHLLQAIQHSEDYYNLLEYAQGQLSVFLDADIRFQEDMVQWPRLNEDAMKKVLEYYGTNFVHMANHANSFFAIDSFEYQPASFRYYNIAPDEPDPQKKLIAMSRGYSTIESGQRYIAINMHPSRIGNPARAIEVTHHEIVHDLGRQLGEQYKPGGDNSHLRGLQQDARIWYTLNRLGVIPAILQKAYINQAHEYVAHREGFIAGIFICDLIDKYISEKLNADIGRSKPRP